jgi:hypothetical protein
VKRATVNKPRALIRVNRGNLPAIKLGTASVRLSRRKRDKKGLTAFCVLVRSVFLAVLSSNLKMVAGMS